jgi:hypothetical protein
MYWFINQIIRLSKLFYRKSTKNRQYNIGKKYK